MSMSPATFVPIMIFNLMSVAISALSSELLLIWFMMEVNMFTFVMMMMVDMSKKSISNSLKYFLYQALASVLFLYSLSHHSSTLVPLSGAIIIMKIGLAPFHFWFMSISKNINLGLFFWMSTVQKLIPLIMFSYIGLTGLILIAVLTLSMVISVMNLLVQVKMLGVLASSSVFANNWLVSAGAIGVQMSLKFMMVYLFLQSSAVLMMFLTGANSSTNMSSGLSLSQSLFTFMILLMLGGMPPSPLFFAKLDLLLMLSNLNMLYLAVALLVSSSVSFYGYININMFKVCLGVRSLHIIQFSSSHYIVLLMLVMSYLFMVV